MSSLVIAGLGISALGFGGRAALRALRHMQKNPINLPKLPKLNINMNFNMTPFYKGGFEETMTRAEAGKILGVSPAASKDKILSAHRKIMIANHPDRGGSPFMATKINEAKELLMKNHS